MGWMPTNVPGRESNAPRRSGFTLIELLVVVSIIAILISVLLPSLKSAREQAKEVVCKAEVAGIGRGLMTYASGHRDYYSSGSFDPETSNGRDGPVDQVGWVADLVNAELAFPNEMLCPSNPAKYNQKLGLDEDGVYSEERARDLLARGYNSNYTQSWFMARTEWDPNKAVHSSSPFNIKRVDTTKGPLRIDSMLKVSPSRVPLLSDGRTDTDDTVLGERAVKSMSDGPFALPYDVQNYADFGPAHGFSSRIFSKAHNRFRCSVLFADGHVGTLLDTNRDGEFSIDNAMPPPKQTDLKPDVVFDGVLSVGRRLEDPTAFTAQRWSEVQ